VTFRRVAVLATLVGLGACAQGPEPAARHAAPDAPVAGPQGITPQFIAQCGVSHYAFDDPIVHPGHVGSSHQHVFFGNVAVRGDSRFEDLLDADTTCDQPLDTASYWTPALLDEAGRRIDPIGSVAYYRPGPGIEPASVVPYPPGLMLVAGDAAATTPQPVSVVAWSCGVAAARSPEPPVCPPSTTLRLIVTFPDCWDGEHLRPVDSDDVTSHAAYSSAGECPVSHPVPIPQLQFAVDHPPVEPSGLTLSSGPIVSGHADFWNAWDQEKLVTEVELCLHRELVCGVTANRHPA
jgi:hypothetical protein